MHAPNDTDVLTIGNNIIGSCNSKLTDSDLQLLTETEQDRKLDIPLYQRFPTWGTRTPRVT